MLLPSIRNLGLVALAAFVAAKPPPTTYDISVPKDPLGNLKVTLDYSAATTWPKSIVGNMANNIPRTWQYSSHIVFADTVVYKKDEEGNKVAGISDGELWQISRDAVDEMVADRENYGMGLGAEPTAMGILAWGNEILLTSSMKGAPAFFYDFEGGESIVGKVLTTCAILSQRHKNRANCAEPMSAHLYYKDIGITRKPLAEESPRIGVWVKRSGSGWTPTDPCGTGETTFWGCNLFTKAVGMNPISTTTPLGAYELEDLAGGPISKDQIQLCGEVREFWKKK